MYIFVIFNLKNTQPVYIFPYMILIIINNYGLHARLLGFEKCSPILNLFNHTGVSKNLINIYYILNVLIQSFFFNFQLRFYVCEK